MKRRYGVKAVFDDPDFDLGEEPKRFWSRVSANYHWYTHEQTRKQLGIDGWHWIVVDLRTGEDISPEGLVED